MLRFWILGVHIICVYMRTGLIPTGQKIVVMFSWVMIHVVNFVDVSTVKIKMFDGVVRT